MTKKPQWTTYQQYRWSQDQKHYHMEPKAEGKKQILIMILSFNIIIIIIIYIFKPMVRNSLALPGPRPGLPPLDTFPEIIIRII